MLLLENHEGERDVPDSRQNPIAQWLRLGLHASGSARIGKRRPLRLVVRVQELALYGGGRAALTAGIDKVCAAG